MSQLSEVTPSRIGTVYLTSTGLVGGQICRVIWRTAAWNGVARTVVRGIEEPERQEYDVGGASGTLNWPVELLIEWCPDVLRAALQTQFDTMATTYSASLVRAATDASGVERTVAFTALGWVDLTEDTATRFGSRTYTGVLATLISEA